MNLKEQMLACLICMAFLFTIAILSYRLGEKERLNTRLRMHLTTAYLNGWQDGFEITKKMGEFGMGFEKAIQERERRFATFTNAITAIK